MREPGYWKYEITGVLTPTVERYLRNEELSPKDIALLRAYLRQWINASAWDENPHGSNGLDGLRDLIDSLTTRVQIDSWTRRALDQGIDPW